VTKILFAIARHMGRNNWLFYLLSSFAAGKEKNPKFLPIYDIEGCLNLDSHTAFHDPMTYPSFGEDLINFKRLLRSAVKNREALSILKFGDGDYHFLKGEPVGSALPGRRALSRALTPGDLSAFNEFSRQSDLYLCEIYPENRDRFREIFGFEPSFPAEFAYGLLASRWLFREFPGKIGIIGADKKLDLIEELLNYRDYRDYLGLKGEVELVRVPQKFACDDYEAQLDRIREQLSRSTSDIFLVGIGHLKAIGIPQMPNFHRAVYLDVGSGIDALAGIVDIHRPYFGEWRNYRLPDKSRYREIDFLQGLDKNLVLLPKRKI